MTISIYAQTKLDYVAGYNIVLNLNNPELGWKNKEWYVKTFERKLTLSGCNKLQIIAKLIFATLFTFGLCWVA